jgi:hypothetical protein
VRSFRCSIPAAETISEQTSPAPKRRPCRRNAWIDTPAIGASTILVGTSMPPIDHDSLRLSGIARWYRQPFDGR